MAGTVIIQKGYAISLNSYIDPNLKPIVNGKLYFTKDIQFDTGGTFSTDGTVVNTKFEFKFTSDYNYSLIYYLNKLFALGGTGFAGKIYEINPTINSTTIFYDEGTDSVKCDDFSEPTLINDKIIFAGSFFNGSQFDKELFMMNPITTSTKDTEKSNSVAYKINYLKDQIVIQINEPDLTEIKLFDISGQNLKSLKSNLFMMDKSSYAKGIYFATIRSNLKESIVKIIIN